MEKVRVTMVSPRQECRQCRASSVLLPPPGKQLELHRDSSFSTADKQSGCFSILSLKYIYNLLNLFKTGKC